MIGQEYAKKILSVAVYNHYKRLKNNLSSSSSSTTVDEQLPSGEQQPMAASKGTLYCIITPANLFLSFSLSQGLPHQLAGHGVQLYTQPTTTSSSTSSSKPTKEDSATASTPSSPQDTTEVRLEKSNIILLGPTGCGESAETLPVVCPGCVCIICTINVLGNLLVPKDMQCHVQVPSTMILAVYLQSTECIIVCCRQDLVGTDHCKMSGRPFCYL